MTTLDELPIRDDLRGQTPYGAPQLHVPVQLNTNENSYDVPEDAVEAMTHAVVVELPHLNRYPDREHVTLRQNLTDYLNRTPGLGITMEQVWAANGSNEVLQQLLQAFGGPGRTALGFTPSYSMHPIITKSVGTQWVDGERETSFDLATGHVVDQIRSCDPDVVFICSPNNPTGTAVGLDLIEAAYEATDGMLIVDEAYQEFARAGTASALTLLPGRPRLVVSRTMSKAFALAGARVGYLVADPAVLDAVRLVRLPYHLAAQTQAVANAALTHATSLLATVQALREQRDRIVDELSARGLQPVPSDANFVLFGGLAEEKAIWQRLLDHGVLIRDVGIPGHLRVSSGTPDEVTAFLVALDQVLSNTQQEQ